jgi:hypothetical protein
MVGLFITLKEFNTQIHKLYKKSNSTLNYDEWLIDSKWDDIPILFIFCWPLALVILLLSRIIQFFKRNDK